MELQGLKMVEVHHTVVEMRKTHAAVGRNLAEVRAAAGQRGSGVAEGARACERTRVMHLCIRLVLPHTTTSYLLNSVYPFLSPRAPFVHCSPLLLDLSHQLTRHPDQGDGAVAAGAGGAKEPTDAGRAVTDIPRHVIQLILNPRWLS